LPSNGGREYQQQAAKSRRSVCRFHGVILSIPLTP
jgi:hypothetical protein